MHFRNSSRRDPGHGHGGLALAGELARRPPRRSVESLAGRVAPVSGAWGGIRLTSPGGGGGLRTHRRRHLAIMTSPSPTPGESWWPLPPATPTSPARARLTCRTGKRVLLVPGRTGNSLGSQRPLREGRLSVHSLSETNTFPVAGPAASAPRRPSRCGASPK